MFINKRLTAYLFLTCLVFLSGCASKSAPIANKEIFVSKGNQVENNANPLSVIELNKLQTRISDLEVSVNGGTPLKYPYFSEYGSKVVLVSKEGEEFNEEIVVEDINKLAKGLPKGAILSLFTSQSVGNKLFFVEYFDQLSKFGKTIWSFDLDNSEMKKLKTPYRDWTFSINESALGAGFGEPNDQGEVRSLYFINLIDDREVKLTTLPDDLSFTPAVGKNKKSVIQNKKWEGNSLFLEVYSTTLPAPVCSFFFLTDGEYCTKRTPVLIKEFRHAQ